MRYGQINLRTKNIFERWDNESSVRSRTNHHQLSQADIDSTTTKNWFPPEMLVFLRHSAIKAMPNNSIKYLQAHYLVHFLDYTTTLEHTVVNRAVENIVHDRMGIKFSKDARDAGLKIYTDEGYHAQFSADLAEQIVEHFRFPRIVSARITKLSTLLETSNKSQYSLIQFLIGFVSETIIASELLDLSRHKLIAPVHNVFRDHLHDEARHAQYFSDCFVSIWQHLKSNDRTLAVQYLPKILDIFCQIDEPWLAISLMTCPTPPACPKEIIADSRRWAMTRVSQASLSTVEAIKRTDLLNNPAFKKLFVEKGLINEH
ncbi:P-aminobenzoate N-oxygenase AurF [compost metagenome]